MTRSSTEPDWEAAFPDLFGAAEGSDEQRPGPPAPPPNCAFDRPRSTEASDRHLLGDARLTCSPSVEHRRADRVDVGHDLDCPAVDTGPALVIGPPRTPTNGRNHP